MHDLMRYFIRQEHTEEVDSQGLHSLQAFELCCPPWIQVYEFVSLQSGAVPVRAEHYDDFVFCWTVRESFIDATAGIVCLGWDGSSWCMHPHVLAVGVVLIDTLGPVEGQ